VRRWHLFERRDDKLCVRGRDPHGLPLDAGHDVRQRDLL
jgi:hypothetical protein